MKERVKYESCKEMRMIPILNGLYHPHIGNTPHILAGAKYFTKLDLKSGYWQVQLKEEDKPKTAFQVYINIEPFIIFARFWLPFTPLYTIIVYSQINLNFRNFEKLCISIRPL